MYGVRTMDLNLILYVILSYYDVLELEERKEYFIDGAEFEFIHELGRYIKMGTH